MIPRIPRRHDSDRDDVSSTLMSAEIKKPNFLFIICKIIAWRLPFVAPSALDVKAGSHNHFQPSAVEALSQSGVRIVSV